MLPIQQQHQRQQQQQQHQQQQQQQQHHQQQQQHQPYVCDRRDSQIFRMEHFKSRSFQIKVKKIANNLHRLNSSKTLEQIKKTNIFKNYNKEVSNSNVYAVTFRGTHKAYKGPFKIIRDTLGRRYVTKCHMME